MVGVSSKLSVIKKLIEGKINAKTLSVLLQINLDSIITVLVVVTFCNVA